MDLGLTGRVAVVAGASRGLGRAVADVLVEEGARVVALSRGEGVVLKSEAGQLCAHGPLYRVKLDLSDASAIDRLVEKVRDDYGRLDVVVACAGGSERGDIWEVPRDSWMSHFAVKPMGIVGLMRAVWPTFVEQRWGRMVCISGAFAREPNPWSIQGAMLNSATLAFVKGMSREAAAYGVTINAISPGHVEGDRWLELVEYTAKRMRVEPTEAARDLLSSVPTGRLVKPREVAWAVAFLSSELAQSVTGCNLVLDGGRSRAI